MYSFFRPQNLLLLLHTRTCHAEVLCRYNKNSAFLKPFYINQSWSIYGLIKTMLYGLVLAYSQLVCLSWGGGFGVVPFSFIPYSLFFCQLFLILYLFLIPYVFYLTPYHSHTINQRHLAISAKYF